MPWGNGQKRREIPSHRDDIGNYAISKFLLEYVEDFLFVERKVISHCGRIEFYKQYFILDIYFSCSLCNGLTYKPFPRVDNTGFIIFICKPVGIQHVANRLPHRLKFIFL